MQLINQQTPVTTFDLQLYAIAQEIRLRNWDELGHHVIRLGMSKVRKQAHIRNRYNQVPHLAQDTNGKVTNSQESQEVSPFPAGDHKASTSRRARKHNKHKTRQVLYQIRILLMVHVRYFWN